MDVRGDCERTGNRGLDPYFFFVISPPCLSPVCECSEVGRHGDAVCCVGASTVPTAGFLFSSGKTDPRLVYAPAPLPGFLSGNIGNVYFHCTVAITCSPMELSFVSRFPTVMMVSLPDSQDDVDVNDDDAL